MFLKVSDSKNKKSVFATLKSKVSMNPNYKMGFPVYFPISQSNVFFFDEEKINKTSESFLNTLKVLKFTKEHFRDIKNFLIFFENNGKLNILIKEDNFIIIEEGIALEIASLLVFYEKYSEGFKFFYIPSESIIEIINSLKEIYELHDSIFEGVNIELTEEDKELISGKFDLFEAIKNLFKKKEKKEKRVTRFDKYIKKFQIYKKEIIALSVIIIIAGGGFVYYQHYQEQKKFELKRQKELEALKKKLNFSIANKNLSKVDTIKNYIEYLKSPVLSIKGDYFSTYVYDIDLTKKYDTIVKISKDMFYVEGKIQDIKGSEEIKDIKELMPLDINEVFDKYNRRGFMQKGILIITKKMTKEELDKFLDYIKKDNVWTFDIFIKRNTGKIKESYTVNATIYKAKKKKQRKKKKNKRKKV